MIRDTGSSNAINFTSLQRTINSLSTEEILKKVPKNSGDNSVAFPKHKPLKNDSNSKKTDTSNKNNEDLLPAKRNPEKNIDVLKNKNVDGEKTNQKPLVLYGHAHKDDAQVLLGGQSQSVTNSFDALAIKLGAVNSKISKVQLFSYLQTLKKETSDPAAAQEMTFVKNLIARFDTLSGGTDYITSFQGVKEPQDYKTVTPDQVTPPVDIRI